jgi:hypothetical protein
VAGIDKAAAHMIELVEHADTLDILSPLPVGKRLFFALLALFPLLAPYELLLRIQWTTYLHPFFLLAAFISAGAAALSLLLLFAAITGLNVRMTLDLADSTFVYSEGAPLIPQRTRVFPLSLLESVRVRVHEWSDGAPSYSIEIHLADGQKFNSASIWSKEEVEHIRNRIETFLERGSPSGRRS